jgi:hypothetical protein
MSTSIKIIKVKGRNYLERTLRQEYISEVV